MRPLRCYNFNSRLPTAESLILEEIPMSEPKSQHADSVSEKDVKAPNILERAKEEIEAVFHSEKSLHRHDKETHGMSDDIDENTPISEVKAPSVLHRVKEEIEALAEVIHPKKDSDDSK